MEESYREGPASHPDPESCGDGREAVGEAWTGAHAGQPSSSEITHSGVPTLYNDGEGNTVYVVIQRDTHRPRGVRDPEHAWTLYAREPGDPVNWP